MTSIELDIPSVSEKNLQPMSAMGSAGALFPEARPATSGQKGRLAGSTGYLSMKDLLKTSDPTRGDFKYLLTVARKVQGEPARATHRALRRERLPLLHETLHAHPHLVRGGGVTARRQRDRARPERHAARPRRDDRRHRPCDQPVHAGVRDPHLQHEDVERFAKVLSVPVINALTDGHHPCQSVADMLTLLEHTRLAQASPSASPTSATATTSRSA